MTLNLMNPNIRITGKANVFSIRREFGVNASSRMIRGQFRGSRGRRCRIDDVERGGGEENELGTFIPTIRGYSRSYGSHTLTTELFFFGVGVGSGWRGKERLPSELTALTVGFEYVKLRVSLFAIACEEAIVEEGERE